MICFIWGAYQYRLTAGLSGIEAILAKAVFKGGEKRLSLSFYCLRSTDEGWLKG